MLTDEDRAQLLAAWRADLIPRVCRLTGLPVVGVVRVQLRPEQPDSPEGFMVRLDDGRAVVVPADPREWRTVLDLLAPLGSTRQPNGTRLMRALDEASRD